MLKAGFKLVLSGSKFTSALPSHRPHFGGHLDPYVDKCHSTIGRQQSRGALEFGFWTWTDLEALPISVTYQLCDFLFELWVFSSITYGYRAIFHRVRWGLNKTWKSAQCLAYHSSLIKGCFCGVWGGRCIRDMLSPKPASSTGLCAVGVPVAMAPLWWSAEYINTWD
jgi:hypothetical protein